MAESVVNNIPAPDSNVSLPSAGASKSFCPETRNVSNTGAPATKLPETESYLRIPPLINPVSSTSPKSSIFPPPIDDQSA